MTGMKSIFRDLVTGTSQNLKNEEEYVDDVNVEQDSSQHVVFRVDFMSLASHNHLGVDSEENGEENGTDSCVDGMHHIASEDDAEYSEEEEAERDGNRHSKPLGEVELCLEREYGHRDRHQCRDSQSQHHDVRIVVAGNHPNHVGKGQGENEKQPDISREFSTQSLTTYQHEVRDQEHYVANIV